MVGKGKEFIAKWESRSKEYILHFLEMFHRDGQIVSIHKVFEYFDLGRLLEDLRFVRHSLRSARFVSFFKKVRLKWQVWAGSIKFFGKEPISG